MKAEFVCNLPGPLDDPVIIDLLTVGLTSGCEPRIFVESERSWVRIGNNLIGPPYGEKADPNDIGIYDIVREPTT